MSFNKRFFALFLSLVLILTAAGCSKKTEEDDSTSTTEEITTVSPDDMFTDRDKEIGYDEASAVKITLADNKSTATTGSVKVSGNTVTITDEGDYVVSGKLTDGQIIVDCEKTDKPHIILNGADITCKTSAPIYVKQADKVVITLNKDTNNTLAVTGEFKNIDENNIDSAVFSKDDLTFNGSGTLTVKCAKGHGIVSKDDLVFTGGSYTVTAASHAIDANDSIRVLDGTFNLTGGKDGLHAENTDDTSLGFIYVKSGTFTITADGDGLDASSYMSIDGGTFKITSGGGSKNAEVKQEEFSPFKNSTSTDTDTASAKGIKANGNLTLSGCTITADCADDAIHSNSSVTFNATLTAKSGDDGIHADADTVINGGTINISECYEGLEGQTVTVNGGNINIVASDDGINAAGGNDQSGFGGGMMRDNFAADENSFIKITGGKIVVDASGDGIDSNGALDVTGGETYVWGPTNSGNGALDYAEKATITGGIFVATGMPGMAMNFSSAENQGAMLVNISGSGKVSLKNLDNKEILSFTPGKSYQCAVISCPEIVEGGTYTVSTSAGETSVEMTDSIVGSSNGTGGMMGGGKGGMDGGMMTPNEGFDENMTRPDGFGGGRGNRMPDNTMMNKQNFPQESA